MYTIYIYIHTLINGIHLYVSIYGHLPGPPFRGRWDLRHWPWPTGIGAESMQKKMIQLTFMI